MLRTRITIMALIVVVVVSAVATATSSAAFKGPRWLVKGAILAGSKESTTKSLKEFKLKGSLGSITCKEAQNKSGTHGEIEGSATTEGKGKAELEFKGCTTNFLCEVKSPGAAAGTIVTNTIDLLLVYLFSTHEYVSLIHVFGGGKVLATIEYVGGSCLIKGEKSEVEGSTAAFVDIAGKPAKEKEEAETHELNFKGPNVEYEEWNGSSYETKKSGLTLKGAGAGAVELIGLAETKLTSKEKWGISE